MAAFVEGGASEGRGGGAGSFGSGTEVPRKPDMAGWRGTGRGSASETGKVSGLLTGGGDERGGGHGNARAAAKIALACEGGAVLTLESVTKSDMENCEHSGEDATGIGRGARATGRESWATDERWIGRC